MSTFVKKTNFLGLAEEARLIRKGILEMVYRTKSSHVGSCFSIVDILTVLYHSVLSIPSPADHNRDIFILSKGHAAAALYVCLASRNFFPKKMLNDFCENGASIAGHVIKNALPGIEATSGSLGHGLPMLAGMALANKGNNRWFCCLLGDGECDEGSVWESAAFCSQFKLSKITAIIDCNNQQGLGYTDSIMKKDLRKRWEAFGWEVAEVNGHDYSELLSVLAYSRARNTDKPFTLIANTVKGKGVSWMEDSLDWHYKSPNEEQFKNALLEIEL